MKRILTILALLATAPALAQSPPSGTASYVPDNTVSGTLGSLNAIAGPILTTGEYGVGVVIPAASTLIGVLTPYCSADGTTYASTSFYPDASGSTVATLTTASGTYYAYGVVLLPACRYVTVKATGYTSGTATAVLNATQAGVIGNLVVAMQTTPAQYAAGIYATNTPNNEQRVMDEPHQIMVDGYDAALDTTDRWSTPTCSGGATLAVSSGSLTLTLGTTTGAYCYTTTQQPFTDVTPGQLRYAFNIAVEATPFVASTYRFWGAGTPQAAPSTLNCPACSNTMMDGVGFELNTDQKLYSVVYKSGQRTAVLATSGANDITPYMPTDASTGNYSVFWRPVRMQWLIGSQEVPVSAGNYVQSALAKDSLPACYLGVQGGTTTATLSSNTMSVSDTAKNANQLADGLFPWRKATVKKPNAAPNTATDLPLVVSPVNFDAYTSATLSAACASATVACPAGQAISIPMAGLQGAGVVFTTGCTATMAPDVSFDGGTTWATTYFDSPAGAKSATVVNPTAASHYSVVGAGGASHVRVRVSAYTSSCVATLRASTSLDPSVLFAATTGSAAPPSTAQVGGTDGTNVQPITIKAASTAPVATDKAAVTTQSPNGGNPCQNPTATLNSVSGATSGTASVQLVALSGSTKIYVCSATVVSVSGTAPTFRLTYGTGTACATGTGSIIPSFATATTAGTLYQFATPVGVTPAGNALCYLDAGTTPVQNYAITYVQQ